MIDQLTWRLKRRARRWAGRAETLRQRFGTSDAVQEPVAPEPIAPSTAAELPAEAPAADEALVAAAPAEEGTMTMESVQEILDDLIRPALQSDGGDCTLLKVENDNVYLKLIGACDGCPSSTITLRMGIETVLKEEFPQMKELVQVEHSF